MTFVDICYFTLYLIFIVWLRFVNHLLNYLLTYLLSKRLDFGDDPDHDADPRIFKGIFIARQRAMRAERDIVLPIPSV